MLMGEFIFLIQEEKTYSCVLIHGENLCITLYWTAHPALADAVFYLTASLFSFSSSGSLSSSGENLNVAFRMEILLSCTFIIN